MLGAKVFFSIKYKLPYLPTEVLCSKHKYSIYIIICFMFVYLFISFNRKIHKLYILTYSVCVYHGNTYFVFHSNIKRPTLAGLWKSKTSPKLRHFLWRFMSGALAVKQQLCSRGIPIDPCCPLCRQGPESICHMLFHCPSAKEVWERSSIPLPELVSLPHQCS